MDRTHGSARAVHWALWISVYDVAAGFVFALVVSLLAALGYDLRAQDAEPDGQPIRC